jgi:hypothetical protein
LIKHYFMKTPMDHTEKRICGARNRQGKPCQKPPMKGKNRCLAHGGKTPTGTKGNRKHGLYSAYLTEAEQEQWDGIQLGVVDEELKMLRIYLARCVALDAQISKDPNSTVNSASMELTEVRRSSGQEGPISVDVISKRPDVMSRMNWIIGRIAQLEKTRSELLAAERAAGEGDKIPMPWVD